MESPRKREVFAEKEQLTIEAENLEMLRKRIAEDVAENERRDEPSSKSRRKSAKPTKIFVEEEDEEEIIEEIFIDTDPLTPSCDDFATTLRIVKPKSGEENGEKESMEFSDRLDIHKIKHYDNCNENDGEIIPLRNIDLERLHKGTQNHLLHRKKEIHVKLKNSPESPILSPLSLLQRSMPQTTNVVATVNVKTVSNNNAPVLQQKLSQPQVIPQNLDEIREKAVAIKSCMELTSNEIEQLILGGLVVKVSNRKKPDHSLKYSCKFCIWYSRETNGQVKLRSFGRKEEIKRHHMLHLRYERFQCQYCPYKVVRSDHLHRHMKNKHPEVNHPGPQSTRSKRAQLEYGDTASPLLDFPPTMVNTHNRPSSLPQIPNMQNDFLNLIQNATNGAPNPAQLIQSFLHFQRLAQNIPQTAQVEEEPETAEITVESDNEEESTISGSS
ncbi:unnamed protein product [Oikopleura dioica]|uniref:C2H2-type domain-containing protein n=1 Tax=Oikopleura dioica TaxID=34765 RepID=E4YPQ1_OIKDI|nr:unnamed protein product [Oikopleura dioica]